MPIPTITSVNSTLLREQQAKQSDILKLENILSCIAQYETGNLDLRTTLLKIGLLCGGKDGILYNDKDTESFYIRNKYGYIQRNKQNAINPNGIYFEALYRLKTILENTSYILEPEELFRGDLISLKQQIIHILIQEGPLVSPEVLSQIQALPSVNETLDISTILKFSKIGYEQSILERAVHELSNLSTINFSIQEDRYYLARTLTILGELMHEFLEGKDREGSQLLKAFHTMDHIRSSLIHNHRKIAVGFEKVEDIQKCENLIKKIKNIFLTLIIEENSHNGRKIFNIQDDPTVAEELSKIVKELEVLLEKKFAVNLSSIASTNLDPEEQQLAKDLKELRSLIIKAAQLFESPLVHKSQTNKKGNHYKKPEMSLEQLNDQYKQVILKVGEQKNYPTEITEEHKQIFIKIAIDLKSEARKKTDQERKLHRDQKSEKAQLNKQEQVSKLLEKIGKELKYLKELEADKEIEISKKEYAIQHIVTLIGQYMRDVEETNTELYKESSIVAIEASISAKHARNQGLAHNIFSFAYDELINRIQNDILPAHEDFQALFTVYNHSAGDIPMSVLIMNNLAASFFRLSMYSSSIKYLEQALQYIESQPLKVAQEKVESTGLAIDINRIAVFTDLSQQLFGIDSYVFLIKCNMINVYISANKYHKAKLLCESLIESLDLDMAAQFGNEELHKNLSQVLFANGMCLSVQGDSDEALYYYNKALSFASGFSEFTDNIYVHMASCYKDLGNLPKAEEIFLTRLESSKTNPIVYFAAISHYLSFLSDKLDKSLFIVQAEKHIVELNKVFNENIGMFKSLQGDNYLLLQLEILVYYISLVQEKACLLITHNIALKDELEKQEEKIVELVKKLRPELATNEMVIRAYSMLSKAYSSMIQEDTPKAEAQHLLKKSVEYSRTVESLVGITHPDAISTVDCLAKAYSNHATWHITDKSAVGYKLRLLYLEKALNLQTKYSLNSSVTLANIAYEYQHQGESAFTGGDGHTQSYTECDKNYTNALEYFAKSLDAFTGLEHKDPIKDILLERIDTIALCYERLGYIREDAKLIMLAVKYYEQILKTSGDHSDIEGYIQKCLDLAKQALESRNYTVKTILDGVSTITHYKDKIIIGAKTESQKYSIGQLLSKVTPGGVKYIFQQAQYLINFDSSKAIRDFTESLKEELQSDYSPEPNALLSTVEILVDKLLKGELQNSQKKKETVPLILSEDEETDEESLDSIDSYLSEDRSEEIEILGLSEEV